MTWKLPVTLSVLATVAFIFFGLLGPQATAKFGVSSSGDFFQLPAIEVPAFLCGIVLSVIMLGLAGYAVYLKTRGTGRTPLGAGQFIVLFVAAFLIWVVGGARTPSISLAGLIAGSVTLAVPSCSARSPVCCVNAPASLTSRSKASCWAVPSRPRSWPA